MTAPPATTRTRSLLRLAAGWAVSLSIAFGLIVLGELSVTMQAIQSAIAAGENAWLAAAIAVASLGLVLLVGGAIHLAIRGRGKDSATLAEVKSAWRSGAWRRSTRWRRMIAMMMGALLMMVGVFGIPFVLGTAGIKMLIAAAWAYAVFQVVRGFRRADIRTGGTRSAGSPPDGSRSRRGKR